jgi:hypothetical protein
MKGDGEVALLELRLMSKHQGNLPKTTRGWLIAPRIVPLRDVIANPITENPRSSCTWQQGSAEMRHVSSANIVYEL